MTLIEFINHIKHKSVEFRVFDEIENSYCFVIGQYMHFIHRDVFDNAKIIKIIPTGLNSFDIYVFFE